MPVRRVNGVELYWEQRGSGPRLLFCNGSGTTLQTVRPLLDLVAAKFDLLAWDYGGLGRSVPLTGPYCRRSANSLGGRSRNSAPGPFVDGAVAALLSSISWVIGGAGHRVHRTRRACGWGRRGPARFSCLRGPQRSPGSRPAPRTRGTGSRRFSDAEQP